MILYTLLTTHKDKDITNILLTATLIYYLAYSSLPAEKNYIIVAAAILVDLYFTSNANIKGPSRSKSRSKSQKHGLSPRLKQQLARSSSGSRKVRFSPNNTMHSYNPELPPRIMPQIQPPRAVYPGGTPYLPQTTNPAYNQYVMQNQMARGQHIPVQLNSQYHQPGMAQYNQSSESRQAPPLIDNRHLVPVDDDSSSSGSSISMDSETISISSEEY